MAASKIYQVNVRPEIYSDLNRIYDFYAPKDPNLAIRVLRLISDMISGLGDFPGPYRFPASPVFAFRHFREAYIPFGKDGFIIRYDVDDDAEMINVYRVHHSREDRFESSE